MQRTMLELLNQLDGFEATKNIKVGSLIGRSTGLDPVRAFENFKVFLKCLYKLWEKCQC